MVCFWHGLSWIFVICRVAYHLNLTYFPNGTQNSEFGFRLRPTVIEMVGQSSFRWTKKFASKMCKRLTF